MRPLRTLDTDALLLLHEQRRRTRWRREIATWRAIARPEQLPPDDDDWLIWYIQAGRGWGKTRTGAEYVFAQSFHVERIAIVADSFAEARDVCVEGESGIKRLHPDVQFNRSLGELRFLSGAKGKIYSAEDPESLRGPNLALAWCDEIAKWRHRRETWDNLSFSLRLGARPRVVITTTPRPCPLLAAIKARPTTRLVRGSTYDNIANLSPAYIAHVVAPYEGTLQGRQELYAEDIDDAPGALWTAALIEERRVATTPEFVRVVTAIDPSATADGDEAGIVTVGAARVVVDGRQELHAYVLGDDSVRGSPERWAHAAVAACARYKSDALIAEANNGGEMVRVTIGTIPGAPPVRLVHASRGKYTRAEPISLLTQQGRVWFVGLFPALELELRSWTPGDARSPNRLDAFVWAVTALLIEDGPIHRVIDYYRRTP